MNDSSLNLKVKNDFVIDPLLDLVFERKSQLSIDQFWDAWTKPELIKKWFCPKPWKVEDCKIDLKPCGEFYTLMKGPNGESVPNHGAFLALSHEHHHYSLVFTNLMSSNFRPNDLKHPGFSFIAIIQFIHQDNETIYKAIVKHATLEGKKSHEEMGFQEGWGMAFNQLEALW